MPVESVVPGKSLCAVVVPIYRKPTLTERFALDCLQSVLGAYPKFFLKPLSLSYGKAGFSNCSLEDRWFASARTYGAMMASAEVYE